MYKILPLNNDVDESIGLAERFETIGDLTKAGLIAQTTMLETLQRISRLREILQPHHKSSCVEFNTLRDKLVAEIQTAEYKGVTLFNGQIDIDAVFSGEVEGSVRIRIPDLISLFSKFYSNFAEVSRVDEKGFAERVINSEKAHPNTTAAIQGVRLNTFMTRTVKSSRMDLINSLSKLTGLHATSYGNSLVGTQKCRQTQMPVHEGCIHINGVSIDACDGSVSGLVERINEKTAQHGVRAVAEQGKPMALISYSGHKIEITISNQGGALLSGFPPGVSEAHSQTGGLTVWISFLPIHTVNFNSKDTAEFVSGGSELSLALKPNILKDLSIGTPLERQLTTYILQVMQTIVQVESDCLSRSISRLNELQRQPNDQVAFGHQLKTSKQIITP